MYVSGGVYLNNYDLYKESILKLVSQYNKFGSFNFNENDFDMLSDLLKIDKELLKNNYDLSDSDSIENKNYIFFDNIFRFCNINRNYQLIINNNQFENVLENVINYGYIIDDLTWIATNISVFQCQKLNYFTRDYLLYSYGQCYPWEAYYKYLKLYTNEIIYSESKDFLSIIYTLLNYELQSLLNSLYFVNSLLLISSSEEFSENIQNMAYKLFEDSIFLFKDAHIISYKINSLYHDISIDTKKRTRFSNTTCLQIYYSYANTDVYSLRLDLPHQGIDFIHYNNISPGGTKCYLFTNEEYEQIISKHKELKQCFIKYTNGFALKEKINCNNIKKEYFEYYDALCKNKEHEMVFDAKYKEYDLIDLMEILSYILPSSFYSPVDIDDLYTSMCFDYANLMSIKGIMGLYFGFHYDKNITKTIFDNITKYAVRVGIISFEEKEQYMNYDGVCMIVDLAKSKL